MVLALALGQHEQVVAGRPELGDAVLPEFERDIVGGVAAETVDTDLLDPEFHGVDHRLAEIRVVEVQVRHIVPAGAGRTDDVAGFVVGVPFRMVLDPRIVPGSVVGDPVDDDGHAALVGAVHEGLEVHEGAEFRVDGGIVLDAIGALDGFLYADFADWHEPDDVGAQVLDGVQTGGNGLERMVRCKVARIDLVHDDIFRSRDGRQRCFPVAAAGHGEQAKNG